MAQIMSARAAAAAIDPTLWDPSDFAATPTPKRKPKPKTVAPISIRALAEGHLYRDPAPVGCRDIGGGFRYAGNEWSLREVLRRHADPKSRKIRFLFLNAFLLQAPDIPWGAILGDPHEALALLGIGSGQLIAEITGNTALAQAAAVALELLTDPVGFVAKLTGIKNPSDMEVVDQILKLTKLNIGELLVTLGFLPRRFPGEAPLLAERASEIGAAIGADYDLIGLCEVWTEELRGALVAAAGPAFTVNPAAFDRPTSSSLGSGLLFLARTKDLPVAPSTPQTFQERGSRFVDADAWADKGFLVTRVDLGIGSLEIHTLHTISGNDFGIKNITKHDDAELLDLQMNQVAQMLEAIGKERPNSHSVRLICGDFNIKAFPPSDPPHPAAARSAGYQKLVDAMSAAGFIEAWNVWNGPSLERVTHTDIAPEARKLPCKFEGDQKLCQVIESGSAPEHNNDGQCIDYIFIERPVESHGFRLDVSRVRRRHFVRAPAGDVGYMSDHMGLDVTLIASPLK